MTTTRISTSLFSRKAWHILGFLFLCTAVPLSASADQACSSFSPIAIPDNNATGIVGSLTISPHAAAIQDLNLKLDLIHTYVGDLIVTLKHVDTGTTVTLIDRMARTPPTIGSCNADNLDITLDDQGTGGAVETICGPGPNAPTSPPSFVPNNPLAQFNAENISGTWELRVSDRASIDTGSLNSFCVEWNPTDLAISGSFSEFIGAVGSPAQYSFNLTNNGPYDAEQVSFTAQIPAQFAVTDATISKGEYFLAFGGPFLIFVGTIPSLAVGETVNMQIQVVPSIIASLLGGPPVDSTVLFINSPAGAPREVAAYPIAFDASLHPASVTAPVVLANDGLAPVPGALTSDGCEPLSAADLAGKIALIDNMFAPLPGYNGTPPPPPCGIPTALTNAINAGAVGVIFQNVTNNAGPYVAALPPPPPGQPIPAVIVASEMGATLRGGGNATIQLGRAGVWETFTSATINTSGDDPVDDNNILFFVSPVGKDGDDDGTADAIDACPVDPAKTAVGVCGCGKVDSTLDINFNSVADCNEVPSTIVPPKPKLKQITSGVRVTMPKLAGANYVVNLAIKGPGESKAKRRVIRSSKNVVLVRDILVGSSLAVQYSFTFTAPGIASSQKSEKAKLKTK